MELFERIRRDNGTAQGVVTQQEIETIIDKQGDAVQAWMRELRAGGQYATAGFLYRKVMLVY